MPSRIPFSFPLLCRALAMTITPRSSSDLIGNYGNLDISSGVIGFGDEGSVIGDIVVVSFLIDFGRPQTSDSVELTNASFGLLGSHIFAFSSGDMKLGGTVMMMVVAVVVEQKVSHTPITPISSAAPIAAKLSI